MIKLSDYVFNYISGFGVDKVFFLPGGGCMHLVDSLGRNEKIDAVCCLHEQACSIGADAYSQVHNDLGVALVTTGPGATNAITGVAGSWIDSVPVLILSGQVKRCDLIGTRGVRQMGAQEVDVVSMVKGITKYAETIMDPNDIKYHLDKAVYLAKSGRPGPVWLDVPLDVQGATIDESALKEFKAEEEFGLSMPDISSEVKKLIDLINASDRPAILLGNGVRQSCIEAGLEKFVEKLNIPIQTTWKSIDLVEEGHPLFYGRPGSIASRYANYVQQNSDLFITLGARLDYCQIGFNYKGFAPNAKKVVIDIDKSEINKVDTPLEMGICSDAGAFINEFLKQADALDNKDRSQWLGYCQRVKEKYPVILPEYKEPGEYANTYYLVDELSEQMSVDDVLVPGSSGSCSEITSQAFRVKKGQRVFNNPGLGSMGYGLPQSIGACISSGKRTITIIGDGGLQHNIQELANVKHRNLPLKIFILNNNGYASIRMMQMRHFDSNFVCCDPQSNLPMPNIAEVTKAYGIEYVAIDKNSDIPTKVKQILSHDRAVLCELMVDPVLPTMPKLSSEVKPDGSIVSKPLEDLWPFIGRDQFEQDMTI